MLRRLSDLIQLGVLLLLVLLVSAWIACFLWPQEALQPVTGPDTWGRTPMPS